MVQKETAKVSFYFKMDMVENKTVQMDKKRVGRDMSILIKGMEMPKKKNGAVLIIYPDGRCAFENGKEYKAVPVPPHGRLIDADLFSKVLKGRAAEELNQHAVPFSWSYAYECLNDTVGLIPTVIPADKDGESR